MDINSIMSGLIPPAQLLQTLLIGLQNELGFEIKKADIIYDRISDRMYFEVALPDGTPINYADKDQFVKGDQVYKRYAYLDKDSIKSAILPLVSNLTGEEIKKFDDVDMMAIRYNGVFELVVAMTVNGEHKKIIKQI